MSQANKHNLMAIAGLLGRELSERLTTEKMLFEINQELVMLHVCIVRLCPRVTRKGGITACRQRMVRLKKLAGLRTVTTERIRDETMRGETPSSNAEAVRALLVMDDAAWARDIGDVAGKVDGYDPVDPFVRFEQIRKALSD